LVFLTATGRLFLFFLMCSLIERGKQNRCGERPGTDVAANSTAKAL
jgi:hypothetical protein